MITNNLSREAAEHYCLYIRLPQDLESAEFSGSISEKRSKEKDIDVTDKMQLVRDWLS